MNLLTKGIFSSLASFIFLFSPVEAINVSNTENSLLFTKSQIVSLDNAEKGKSYKNQQNDAKSTTDNTEKDRSDNNQKNDAKSTALEDTKSGVDAILTIIKDSSKLTISDRVKSWADTIWSVFLDIVFISLFVFLLSLLWGLARKGKGTIVLPFKDFRDQNTLQRKKHEEFEAENKEKAEDENKIGEVISELLVAELYKIRQIYELVGQSNIKYDRNLQALNPDICIDARSLDSNSNNIKNLLAGGNFPIIKFGGGDLARNIGEVTKIDPMVGNISLNNLIASLQQMLPDVIFCSRSSNRRNINGSIQGTENNPKLVAHVESGKHFWAWEVDRKNIKNSDRLDEQKLLSELVKKLAYIVADQLSNHPIGYNNFKKFTELLESYTEYKKNQNDVDLLEKAKEKCLDFFEAEPTHIRSFGLLYNLGIAELENEHYSEAEKLFRNAISLEPYIIRRICELEIPPGKLKWNDNKLEELKDTYKILQKEQNKNLNPINKIFSISKSYFLKGCWNRLFLCTEGRVLVHWSESLSYALNALGQTLEIQFDKSNCGNSNNCDGVGDLRMLFTKSKYSITDFSLILASKTLHIHQRHCDNSSDDPQQSDKCFAYLDESMEAYDRASKLATDDALFLSNLASLKIEQVNMLAKNDYLKESILREAEKHLIDATKKKITKNKHLAYNRLGNLYHEQGDYIKAIFNYEKAIKTKKDFIVVYPNLGIVYLDRRDFDKAIETFEDGLRIITDSELFHGNLYYKQLHAWLHNSIGWTHLMKVMDDHINGHNNCPHEISFYLTRAKRQLKEAIKIFEECQKEKEKTKNNQSLEIPLDVPYLNLGHVYAWQDEVQKAFNNWQKGLKKCNEKDNSKLTKMLSSVYKFAKDKEPPTKKELSDNIDKGERHWRLRYRTLEEAMVVKQSIVHLKEKGYKAPKEKDFNDIESLIIELENHVPSFNLGLAYLWKNDYKSAIRRWNKKICQLKENSKKQNDDKIIKFKDRLWLYIYESLVYFIEKTCDKEHHDRACRHEGKVKFSSKHISLREFVSVLFDPPVPVHPIESCQSEYSLQNAREEIRKCTKEIREYIKEPYNNHAIQKIDEILDDIICKFDILKRGPEAFQEKWVKDNLEKLLEPILTCQNE